MNKDTPVKSEIKSQKLDVDNVSEDKEKANKSKIVHVIY